MLNWAIGAFAIGAVFGLTMAVGHFRGRTPPAPGLAVAHGLFVATGLALLAYAVLVENAGGTAPLALGLFVLAALGGFTLALGYHARQRPLPSLFVVGHATVAVVAFLLLVAGAAGLV